MILFFIGIFIGFWVAAFRITTYMSKMKNHTEEEIKSVKRFQPTGAGTIFGVKGRQKPWGWG
jgi:hypothetical protein